MDEKTFKKQHKPSACTEPPWYRLVTGPDKHAILAKIKQETIAAYGQSYDECTKRKTCFTKHCMGRPLPWKSETAKPYLETLKTTHNIQNGEMVLSNCDTCSIAKSCKSVCSQLNDYLVRDKVEEPTLVLKETIDNIVPENMDSMIEKVMGKGFIIPWDCLPIKRQNTIRKYLYEQKDFLTIAKEQDYFDQAQAKYEFYAALTKLSKVGVIRKMCHEQFNQETISRRHEAMLSELFFLNRDITEVANTWSVSKQAINQMVKKYINKFNLKWQIFVTKKNGKVIYNVPELFK